MKKKSRKVKKRWNFISCAFWIHWGVTHSSTLAWKLPWKEEPGRLQSMGSLRVGHYWATSLFTFMHWRRKWQPTPVFLPGESQPRGSLAACCLWGHKELDTTERLNWTELRWQSVLNFRLFLKDLRVHLIFHKYIGSFYSKTWGLGLLLNVSSDGKLTSYQVTPSILDMYPFTEPEWHWSIDQPSFQQSSDYF